MRQDERLQNTSCWTDVDSSRSTRAQHDLCGHGMACCGQSSKYLQWKHISGEGPGRVDPWDLPGQRPRSGRAAKSALARLNRATTPSVARGHSKPNTGQRSGLLAGNERGHVAVHSMASSHTSITQFSKPDVDMPCSCSWSRTRPASTQRQTARTPQRGSWHGVPDAGQSTHACTRYCLTAGASALLCRARAPQRPEAVHTC
jgi:hypothetical protein